MSSPVSTDHCTLATLRQCIRHGLEPDNPTLFIRWQEQEAAASSILNEGEQRQALEHQFHLLLGAVMDELVPAHWRCQCLDQLHRPLAALASLARHEQHHRQLRQLRWELMVSSRYVAHSLN